MKKFFQEFGKFATKGSILDLAVAFMLTTAFGAITQSFVKDIIMPPIGLLLGKVDFNSLYINLTKTEYASLAAAKEAGAAVISYGAFINTLHQLCHRRTGALLYRARGEPREGQARGGSGGTDHEGVPLLPLDRFHQGYALPELHFPVGGLSQGQPRPRCLQPYALRTCPGSMVIEELGSSRDRRSEMKNGLTSAGQRAVLWLLAGGLVLALLAARPGAGSGRGLLAGASGNQGGWRHPASRSCGQRG